MATTPRPDPALLHRQAQVAVLVGLRAGKNVDELLALVAPSDVRGWFKPDVAALELAATAGAGGSAGSPAAGVRGPARATPGWADL